MNRDYSFQMLPSTQLLATYRKRYGKPYKGQYVWIMTYRVRGRNTYLARKTATGVVHRDDLPQHNGLTKVFDETDRLCRYVGIESQWKAGTYYGLRIYGHERCCAGAAGEYVTLDTPCVDEFVCAACGKPLLPQMSVEDRLRALGYEG